MRLRPAVCAVVTSVLASLALAPAATAAASEQAADRKDARERRLIAKAERHGPQDVIVEFTSKDDRRPAMRSLSRSRADYDVIRTYRHFPLAGLRADSTALRRLAGSQRAGTLDEAQRVLAPVLLDSEGAFDRQLLAAWLNFAHGSLELDEKVDTDGLLHPDTTFIEAVRQAEAVRLDPDSTAKEISHQAAILTKINLFRTLR